MSTAQLFNRLDTPKETDRFELYAIPIPIAPNHRIAKDKKGNPIVLFKLRDEGSATLRINYNLQNISVVFDTTVTVKQVQSSVTEAFTCVSYIGSDKFLREYFIKLCDTLIVGLGNEPTYEAFEVEITGFIELIRLANAKPRKTVQGLWAELLIILESRDPSRLVEVWHSSPQEKFDFCEGMARLEVKCSVGAREHQFSIEQLNPPQETVVVVASILSRPVSKGETVTHILSKIEERIHDIHQIANLRRRVAEIIGNEIQSIDDIQFDYQLARDSLKFFDSRKIPKIDSLLVPNEVSEVRFKADLSGVENIEYEMLKELGSFFTSI